MATARSLTGVDWLIRTYANTLLTACGRTSDATAVRGGQTINSNARLTAAITRLDTLEASCKTDYTETWDRHWSTALDTVLDRIVAQCPIPIDEMLTDTDVNVQRALKTAFRALELRACQHVAGGGSL